MARLQALLGTVHRLHGGIGEPRDVSGSRVRVDVDVPSLGHVMTHSEHRGSREIAPSDQESVQKSDQVDTQSNKQSMWKVSTINGNA